MRQRRHRHRNRNNNNNNNNQRRHKKPRLTDRISEHFSKKDFAYVDDDGKSHLKISLGLVGALELLRTKSGNKRVNIEKGYITQDAAEKEGNFKRNYHPKGLAAEVTVDGLSLKEVFLLAEEIDEFKGLGLDLDKKVVHVDTRKEDQRVMWVIQDGKEIDLTPELRPQYLDPSK